MISRLGLRLSEFFRRTAPDPFVLAVLLTLVSAIAALVFGSFARPAPSPPPLPSRLVDPESQAVYAVVLSPEDAPRKLQDPESRVEYLRPGESPPPPIPAQSAREEAGILLDAWRADTGLWRFLAFSMQMCLILVTGHVLAASRPVARGIDALAGLPRNGAQGAAMVGFVAAAMGLVNWGLGLIVGALLAREVGRSLGRRGIRAHYTLLVAAGYMGLMVWHGGLSGSAPLSVTTREGAAKVLPESAMAMVGEDGIPLGETLLSPMNLVVTLGVLVLIPVVLWLLTPKRDEECVGITSFDAEEAEREPLGKAETFPEWLERSPLLAWVLAIALIGAFVRFAGVEGIHRLNLNEVNVAMLALGLVCHGSLASYGRAAEEAARGCAGIIIQFPLYAGIMAMLSASGLIQAISEAVARGGETGVPLLTFFGAAVVNFFVPSGGGQWGIQGPIALEAGVAAGVAPGKMVMAVAYGDQLTNMLQPFWALPLLAITGAKARDIVGYTAVVMVVAGIWMGVALVVF